MRRNHGGEFHFVCPLCADLERRRRPPSSRARWVGYIYPAHPAGRGCGGPVYDSVFRMSENDKDRGVYSLARTK